MSHTKSKISFIIFKAESEENETVDPYVNILKNRGYNAYLVPTLQFEYYNLDKLNNKFKKSDYYSGKY